MSSWAQAAGDAETEESYSPLLWERNGIPPTDTLASPLDKHHHRRPASALEAGCLAEQLIEATCRRQQIPRNQLTIHSDRGAAMQSAPVVNLLAQLDITKSNSRPHVSNDNPFIESFFGTAKAYPTFPDRFGSMEHALSFCRQLAHPPGAWGAVGIIALSSLAGAVGYLTSLYLNQVVSSDRRATLLSVKGLAMNLGFGWVSLAYAAWVARLPAGDSTPAVITAFAAYLPYGTFLVLVITALAFGQNDVGGQPGGYRSSLKTDKQSASGSSR